MKKTVTLSTATVLVKETESLAPSLESACGGDMATLGMLFPSEPAVLQQTPRNISERCPGDQTNNRAELIVGILDLIPHLSTHLAYRQLSVSWRPPRISSADS